VLLDELAALDVVGDGSRVVATCCVGSQDHVCQITHTLKFIVHAMWQQPVCYKLSRQCSCCRGHQLAVVATTIVPCYRQSLDDTVPVIHRWRLGGAVSFMSSICAAAAAAAAAQVVVRTPSRSYTVSQMPTLLRDIGDWKLVSRRADPQRLNSTRHRLQ
jgi:hypothetical protein